MSVSIGPTLTELTVHLLASSLDQVRVMESRAAFVPPYMALISIRVSKLDKGRSLFYSLCCGKPIVLLILLMFTIRPLPSFGRYSAAL